MQPLPHYRSHLHIHLQQHHIHSHIKSPSTPHHHCSHRSLCVKHENSTFCRYKHLHFKKFHLISLMPPVYIILYRYLYMLFQSCSLAVLENDSITGMIQVSVKSLSLLDFIFVTNQSNLSCDVSFDLFISNLVWIVHSKVAKYVVMI